MPENNELILVVNTGSSSIKFGLYGKNDSSELAVGGDVRGIGLTGPALITSIAGSTNSQSQPIEANNHVEALKVVGDWVANNLAGRKVVAVGHRIVQGGPSYVKPTLINHDLTSALKDLFELDPNHVQIELDTIEQLDKLFPGVTQVACFDTAFHADMPEVAKLLSIPRKYSSPTLRRYGFHGLSCTSVFRQLPELVGPDVAQGKLIIAHLGSGASLTAVVNGKSVETTMGFTPAGGILMSTRSGDIDPGLIEYLAKSQKLSNDQLSRVLNFESGLLGVSGTTADMKLLLESQGTDPSASQAVELFCYQAKKAIGSLSAIMGGLDLLVFTGGMGQNAPKIRAKICEGLSYLGVVIDEELNTRDKGSIGRTDAAAKVFVVESNENSEIAANVAQLLASI